MDNCLFCKIVAGEIPVEKLYEDDDALAFRDVSPQAPKHFLVIPKKHISAPAAMTESDDALVGKLLRIGAEVAAENGIAGEFRIVINNGEQAGQVVFHLHIHFLGGRTMGWPPG